VKVPEPTVEEAIQILQGLRERYEIHHKLRYTDEALVAAAQLSHQYIRFLFYSISVFHQHRTLSLHKLQHYLNPASSLE